MSLIRELKRMTIKDFGTRVEDVWKGLRPRTRRMVVGALQTGGAGSSTIAGAQTFSYDAHADWELSRLLTALDERAAEAEAKENPEHLRELRRMANACARVLEAKTESAEVFIQLVTRALLRLQNEGLIEVSSKEIFIPNASALAVYADSSKN